MVFSKLIGNQVAKQTLSSLLTSRLIPHALLFSGAAGVGKKQFALEFAKGIMGKAHARKIDSGHHPDLRIYSPEGKSGLHNLSSIHQMIGEMALPPFEATSRVFILDEAERMLPTSSNALLKTLEEPQPNNYIILISHLPEEILPTLISRCRKVSFFPIPEKEISQWIKERGEKTESEARRIAFLSHGSLSKALELLQEIKNPKRDLLMEVLTEHFQEPAKLTSMAGKLEQLCVQKTESEEDPTFLLKEADFLFEEVFYWYRDLHLLSLGVSLDYLFHFDYLSSLQQKGFEGLPSLEKIQKILEECRLAVQRNIKLKTVLEYLFSELASISKDQSPSGE